jgi:hypothetical protein
LSGRQERFPIAAQPINKRIYRSPKIIGVRIKKLESQQPSHGQDEPPVRIARVGEAGMQISLEESLPCSILSTTTQETSNFRLPRESSLVDRGCIRDQARKEIRGFEKITPLFLQTLRDLPFG